MKVSQRIYKEVFFIQRLMYIYVFFFVQWPAYLRRLNYGVRGHRACSPQR